MQGHPAGQVDGMMGPLVCVSFAQMSPGTSETMMVLGIKLGHDTKKRKRIGERRESQEKEQPVVHLERKLGESQELP